MSSLPFSINSPKDPPSLGDTAAVWGAWCAAVKGPDAKTVTFNAVADELELLLTEAAGNDPSPGRLAATVSTIAGLTALPIADGLVERFVRWVVTTDQMRLATLTREQIVEAVAITLIDGYRPAGRKP